MSNHTIHFWSYEMMTWGLIKSNQVQKRCSGWLKDKYRTESPGRATAQSLAWLSVSRSEFSFAKFCWWVKDFLQGEERHGGKDDEVRIESAEEEECNVLHNISLKKKLNRLRREVVDWRRDEMERVILPASMKSKHLKLEPIMFWFYDFKVVL